MPRVQVGYDPRAEALQTVAAPNIQTEQARNDPNANKAVQLAQAFASPDAQRGLAGIKERVDEKERDAARNYANSRTVAELGQDIKDGKIFESQSPIYVATVQHMYGANLESSLRNETLAALDNGTLKPQDVDAHLAKRQKEMLTNQSEYSAAGFNRSFGQTRNALLAVASQKSNENFKAESAAVTTDYLTNKTDEAIKLFSTKPDEAIGGLMAEYDKQVQTQLLKDPAQRRQALTNILAKMSMTGNEDLVRKFLETKTPNNGPTVAAALDSANPGSSEAMLNHAKSQNMKLGNERTGQDMKGFLRQVDEGSFKIEDYNKWSADNARYLTVGEDQHVRNYFQSRQNQIETANQRAVDLRNSQDSVMKANRSVESALQMGIFNNGAAYQGAKTLGTNGQPKDYNAVEYATQVLMEQTKSLPLDQRVIAFKRAGLVDPQLKAVIETGIGNLYSVGVQTEGKKVGELNDSGKQAIKMYSDIASFDQVAADQVAGTNKDDMRGIYLLMKSGRSDSEAARIINENKSNNMDNVIKKNETRETVRKAVSDKMTPGIIGSIFSPIDTLKRKFGYTPDNFTDGVVGDAIETVTLLYGTGQVPLDAAVKQVSEYYEKTTQMVRGTPYYAGHLPNVPYNTKNPMDQRVYWMEKFLDGAPGKLAKERNLDPALVRLNYNKSNGTYTAMYGSTPMDKNGEPLQYTPDDMNKWVMDNYDNLKKARGDLQELRNVRSRGVPNGRGATTNNR